MKFICSTFGSSGDVFPMLGLAVELQKRGHEVIFATNAHYGERAIRNGLPFEAFGTEADFEPTVRHPDLWHPRRGFPHIFGWIKPQLKRQYDVHAEHAAQGKVVGITNVFGFGALMAQEKLGIPVFTVHLQPGVIWSDEQPPKIPGLFGPRWLKRFMYRMAEKFFVDPVVCPFLNQWRSELGLEPVSKVTRWWHSPFSVVCLFPEWFGKPASDWPKNLIQTDFPLWNDRSSEGLPDEVEMFLSAGPAPLVFTPGSANVHARDFFFAAVKACQSLNHRGILLTEFPEQVPNVLPDTIRHFTYVPLEFLLPRSAAFIHHGGVGSTSQAFAAGVPQVIMMMAHDQFDNAERIEQLGVGSSISANRFTAKRLTRHLDRLLSDPNVPAKCQEVASRLQVRDGLKRAAEAIEARVAQAAGAA